MGRLGFANVRPFRVASLLAATLLAPLLARHAEADETHACIVASEAGQQLRDDRKLVLASDKFSQCARDECPALIRKACIKWLADAAAALPTVVPAARDAAGHDLSAVKVSIDGTPVASQLDGRPFPLDPGPHVLRFEAAGGPPVEENVIVREGERNRLIQVVVQPGTPSLVVSTVRPSPPQSVAAPEPGARTVIPVTAWVFAGVGVVGIASFAYFGATGQSQRSSLESSCAAAGTCNPSDVSAMKAKLIAADVSLGIGVVAAGAAVYFAIARRTREELPRTASSVDFGALRGGGIVRWQGSF